MKIQLYTQGATNICGHFHSTQPHSARIASCEKYYYPELQYSRRKRKGIIRNCKVVLALNEWQEKEVTHLQRVREPKGKARI